MFFSIKKVKLNETINDLNGIRKRKVILHLIPFRLHTPEIQKKHNEKQVGING